MAPGRCDSNSTPLASSIGSASMSARSATTGPPSPTPAIRDTYPRAVVDSRRVSVLARNNVHVSGRVGGRAMMFSHGFGCDQNMWRYVAPAFEADHRVVLFDHVGAGRSDLSAYSPEKYSSLHGYAADVLEICRELDLADVVFVGHSVSAMIGVLAAGREPERFAKLVLVGPSPRYVDDGEYVGGFSPAD